MTRDIELADSDWLLPASLPTCDSCHQDIEVDRHDALVARVAEANPGRKGRRAREVLVPVFLAARDGRPVQRSA
jgi:hypothetical protein